MKSGRVIIKKYGNRRLYDTSESRYVNLIDIAEMVRNGKDVSVVDAKSGEDLTRVTLTQIIVEDAKEQPAGLPLELLKQLIVTSKNVGGDFLGWYLKSAMETYEKIQGASSAFSPLDVVRGFMGGGKSEMEELKERIAELEKSHREGRKGAQRKTNHRRGRGRTRLNK